MNKYAAFEERAALLALNEIFGFCPQKGLALATHLDSVRDLFHTGRKELVELGIREEKFLMQLVPHRWEEACRELEQLDRYQTRFVTCLDDDYPALLKECADAPLGLYLKSRNLPGQVFSPDRPAIAIVGTRDLSAYGSRICTELVRQLALMKPQPLIVSGLALGTDITAHQAALDCGLPTVAVMATGTDRVYPFSHGWTADRIWQAEGSGLVTDYPPGTAPQPLNFIRRNRIMAGICLATVVIESKARGGSLVTARLAASYSREVYAFPGRIHDSRSQGCNELIRQNAATLLASSQQLIEDLGFQTGGTGKTPRLMENLRKHYDGSVSPENLEKLAEMLLTIREETEIGMEELRSRCALPQEDLVFLTSLLESDGFIQIDLLHNCSIHKDFI